MCVLGVLVFANPVACGGRVEGVGSNEGEGGSCPPPAAVEQGAACDSNGETCPSPYPDCGDTNLPCTCQGGTWSCPPGPPCVATGCPAAASIEAGAACTTSPGQSCPSEIPQYDDCTGAFLGDLGCNCQGGTWQCASSQPACVVDASPPPSCPDPSSIVQGLPCSDAPDECPGNPQMCGGQVFYDAFECEGGTWYDVATTDCATVDAGPIDAGTGGG
jgi:hypothetical protein